MTDSGQDHQTMPDLLADLQRSVDRGTTTTVREQVRQDNVRPNPHLDPPRHPAGHTVEQALAYVADRAELCTPSERTLAREVRTLRSDLAAALRRQGEQDAELLIVHDAAATARTEADNIGDAHRYLYAQTSAVVELWRRVNPETPEGKALRSTLFTALPYDLVAELDELAERV